MELIWTDATVNSHITLSIICWNIPLINEDMTNTKPLLSRLGGHVPCVIYLKGSIETSVKPIITSHHASGYSHSEESHKINKSS